jgi:hypothetical protein
MTFPFNDTRQEKTVMDSKPIIKAITYDLLDSLKEGEEFFAPDLAHKVSRKAEHYPKRPMDGTVTRYIRHYSRQRRPIRRIGAKELSKYRMGA